jgi:hypothetical protein
MGSHRKTIAAGIATLLAATSLYPLFIGTAWLFAGLGAIIAVALAGTLTRLRRLPVAACLLAGAAALVLYLNLIFEAGPSFWHFLPTLSSLRQLAGLVGQGTSQSAKYAPPAPELPGMMLLAVGGIGIVAVATDLIAVRLRSAALAGVPLLLLVTEPFAVSASRGWLGILLVFCLGTSGYLGLLAAEGRERIREWEQPRDGAGGPDTSALSSAGRRVGVASVAIALCLPLFIPGLHTTRLLGGQPGIGGKPGDGGGGGGQVGLPAPEAAMSNELLAAKAEPVLRYDAAPVSSRSLAGGQYLQIYVLDQLTGSDWRMVDNSPAVPVSSDAPLPPPPGLLNAFAGQEVRTTVQVYPNVSGPLNNTVLPVPYPALNVSVPGHWQATKASLMVYSSDTQLSGLHYQVLSDDLHPAIQDAQAAGPPAASIVRSDGGVASFKTAALLKVARDATAGKRNDFDKATALQNWLSHDGGFQYTLHAQKVETPLQMLNFLTYTKKGYCQQFAVSMAVLARLLGIPARVVIGYTSGSQQRDGTWTVTTHDAHEWPELYFTGFGWLRFEPTPSGPAGQGTATTPDYAASNLKLKPGGVTATPTAPTPASGGVIGQRGKQLPPDLAFPGTPSGDLSKLGKHGGVTPWEIFGLVVAGLLALALITPSVARLVIRRRRWQRAARGGDAELAHAAWRELADDLIDYRAGCSPSETPRTLGTRISELVSVSDAPVTGPPLDWDGPQDILGYGADDTDDPVAAGPAAPARGERARASVAAAGSAAVRRITMAEERARYAARPVPGSGLRRDSAAVRQALAAAAGRRDRWRARVLPASVLTPAASGLSQAADIFGRLSLSRRDSRQPQAAQGEEAAETRILDRVS